MVAIVLDMTQTSGGQCWNKCIILDPLDTVGLYLLLQLLLMLIEPRQL